MRDSFFLFSMFNQSEDATWYILAAAILSGLVFIILIVALIIVLVRHKKITPYKKSENTRVFIIDLPNKKVTEFDIRDLRGIKEIPLTRFYDQFNGAARNLVEIWVNDLIDKPEKTKSFFEAHIHLSKANKNEFVLLEASRVNKEEKIIHLESHILPKLTVSNTKHSGRHYLIPFETLQAKYQQAVKHGKKKGVGCLIKVFSKRSMVDINTKYTLGAMTIQLINNLTPYLKETRFICLLDINEIFLYDSEISNRSMFFSLANELVRKIEGYLAMNSRDDEYGIGVGAVMFDPAKPDLKAFISRSREMAVYAEKNEESSISLYEENTYNQISGTNNRYGEVASLIHNRSLRYYFTPIIFSLDASIYLYRMDISPYGVSFNSFEELVTVAQESRLLQPLNDVIFSDSSKVIRGRSKVILRLSLAMLKELIAKVEDCHEKTFILALDHDTLDLFDYDVREFNQVFERSKSLGFSLALYFKDNPSSPLDEKLLRKFDMFIIGDEMSEKITKDERIQASIRLVLATYSPYEKPVIIYGLNTIGDLEVAIASGIKFFNCKAIASPSSALEIIDEKKKERVLQIGKRLR